MIIWNQHDKETEDAAWMQEARSPCPPFHITSDWCNCKGEPLFEWVNIVIMELLWNHAFLTRRADFLPPNTKWKIHRRDCVSLKNVRSCCFIHTANLLSIKRECPVTKKGHMCNQLNETLLFQSFPQQGTGCLPHCKPPCEHQPENVQLNWLRHRSLIEQKLFGYDFNFNIQH